MVATTDLWLPILLPAIGSEPSASIWFKRPWSTTAKFVVDGLVYALVTAGIFGWLWPR